MAAIEFQLDKMNLIVEGPEKLKVMGLGSDIRGTGMMPFRRIERHISLGMRGQEWNRHSTFLT